MIRVCVSSECWFPLVLLSTQSIPTVLFLVIKEEHGHSLIAKCGQKSFEKKRSIKLIATWRMKIQPFFFFLVSKCETHQDCCNPVHVRPRTAQRLKFTGLTHVVFICNVLWWNDQWVHPEHCRPLSNPLSDVVSGDRHWMLSELQRICATDPSMWNRHFGDRIRVFGRHEENNLITKIFFFCAQNVAKTTRWHSQQHGALKSWLQRVVDLVPSSIWLYWCDRHWPRLILSWMYKLSSSFIYDCYSYILKSSVSLPLQHLQRLPFESTH